MASKTRTFPIPTPAPGSRPAMHSIIVRTPERNSVQGLDRVIAPAQKSDLVLYHNAADGVWSKQLAERIRGESSGNRHFATQLASWNFSSATDILAEAEKCLRASRFFAIVISKAMLEEDWPALEKLISVLSDLGLAKGRIVSILKENVTMPPVLRLQEWIDFRDGHRFAEGVCDFLTLLREEV